MSLYQKWVDAKKLETAAVAERRELEDQIVKSLAIPKELDGTLNRQAEGYKVKIEGRINRKVDSDKLQTLAVEFGLEDHLSSLFRWKPEINMTAWKAADQAMIAPLMLAITSTPGRPSFTITKE
jgi:hypothetical protein